MRERSGYLMKPSLVTLVACALLALSACSKDDSGTQDSNTTGNGPGDADGFGGRADPPTDSSANDPAQRDAAPGPLSETSPPTEQPKQQENK